jgi:hypothetical protein
MNSNQKILYHHDISAYNQKHDLGFRKKDAVNNNKCRDIKMTKKNTRPDDPDLLVKAIDTLMPDVLKKAVLISIGGILLTEETIRKILSDLKISKEIVTVFVQQSNKAKDEIVRTLSSEFRTLLQSVNVKKEFKNMLKDLKVRVQMEVDFESKQSGKSYLRIKSKKKKQAEKNSAKNK